MKSNREAIVEKALEYYDKMKHQESTCEPEDGLIYALEELDPDNEITMTEHTVLKWLTEIRSTLREIENNPALEEIYRYEMLPDSILTVAGDPFRDCEGNWMPVTASDTATMLKCAYDCAEGAFTAVKALEAIESGIALRLPLNYLRKRTRLPKCPCCASSIHEGTAALSRRDNQTQICEACGMREALEDYLKADADSDNGKTPQKKPISELSTGESMDELTFHAFARILRRARRKHMKTGTNEKEVYQALDDMCIDADTAGAEASGTDNLREAVQKFLREGKGNEQKSYRMCVLPMGKKIKEYSRNRR